MLSHALHLQEDLPIEGHGVELHDPDRLREALPYPLDGHDDAAVRLEALEADLEID